MVSGLGTGLQEILLETKLKNLKDPDYFMNPVTCIF